MKHGSWLNIYMFTSGSEHDKLNFAVHHTKIGYENHILGIKGH